jgi:hypothetical protein
MTNQIEELKEKIATMQHNLKVLEKLEASKTDVERAYRDAYGDYPITDISMGEWDAVSWDAFQKGWEAAQNNSEDISRVLIEGDDAYIMGVKYQRVEKPYCPDDPPEYDEIEWDEKDTPNLQKIIDEMVEERKSQKLWNMVRNELGYSVDCVNEIVDLVERWIPEEQSAKGSQNAYVECSVEGFNDALQKIKGKLR